MQVDHAVWLRQCLAAVQLHLQVEGKPEVRGPSKEGWPATWRHNAGGRVGLALLGIAFTIATCIQLQGVVTKQWHRDYRWAGADC